MSLMATADLGSQAIIKRQLHLETAIHVTRSPNRTNIRLGLSIASSDTMDCLNWVVKMVKKNGPRMSCGKVFCHLREELGEDCWVDRDPEHRVENQLIGMFLLYENMLKPTSAEH